MHAGNGERSPGPPGLWELRKFSRVAVNPLYRALHAWERETARELLGSGNLENFREWPLAPCT